MDNCNHLATTKMGRLLVVGNGSSKMANQEVQVASMMQSQSDIDANSIAGSYTISKVFLWAIPILGFIGTVLGISEAIGGFSTETSDPEKLKESISSVTGGLPQARAADADKTQQQASDQTRQANSAEKAEAAAGVGETEQDEQASDRDADGRRLWEGDSQSQPPEAESPDEQETPQSRDPSGARGGQLDLSG